MHEEEWLAERFEENRSHLRGVAYRMLGSSGDADDAVQEAWLKLSRSGVSGVENLRAWLTTVIARICLDMLRSRNSRRETSQDVEIVEATGDREGAIDPEREALLGESVGLALLVVLEKLDPAERLAFVLHDLFAVPFDEIASIVGRSTEATRQLASRARRRVRGGPTVSDPDLAGQRRVVEAFLAALRGRDFEGLIAVLDPDVTVRTESAEGISEIRGAQNFARSAVAFAENAHLMEMALVDGTVGIVMARGGRLLRAARFSMKEGKISEVNLIVRPVRLRELDLSVLSD